MHPVSILTQPGSRVQPDSGQAFAATLAVSILTQPGSRVQPCEIPYRDLIHAIIVDPNVEFHVRKPRLDLHFT